MSVRPPPDPPRLAQLDGIVAEVFRLAEDDTADLNVEASLERHRAIVASGAPSPLSGSLSTGAALAGVGVTAVVLITALAWAGTHARRPPPALAAPVGISEPGLEGEDPAVTPPEQSDSTGAEAPRPPAAERPPPRSPPSPPQEIWEGETSQPPSARQAQPTRSFPEAELPSPEPPVEDPALDPPERQDALQRELALLARARRALKADDSDAALETARRSLEEFPRGTFREEVLAIEVLALAGSNRTRQAHIQAKKFRESYPRSALIRRIDDALGPPAP